MFQLWVARIECPKPCGELRRDLGRIVVLEHSLCEMPCPLIGRFECLKQLGGRGTNQFRPWYEWAVLRGDTPNTSVCVIASRVAKIHLAMLDDRVIPIGYVNRPIGTHLDVDGSECDVTRLDQFRLLARNVARPLFGNNKA